MTVKLDPFHKERQLIPSHRAKDPSWLLMHMGFIVCVLGSSKQSHQNEEQACTSDPLERRHESLGRWTPGQPYG